MSNPRKQFDEADGDGHGMLLFHEFADWAIKKNLDLDDDDNADNAMKAEEVDGQLGPDAAEQKFHVVNKEGFYRQIADKKIWRELDQKLPWQQTKDQDRRRHEQF